MHCCPFFQTSSSVAGGSLADQEPTTLHTEGPAGLEVLKRRWPTPVPTRSLADTSHPVGYTPSSFLSLLEMPSKQSRLTKPLRRHGHRRRLTKQNDPTLTSLATEGWPAHLDHQTHQFPRNHQAVNIFPHQGNTGLSLPLALISKPVPYLSPNTLPIPMATALWIGFWCGAF